MTSLTEEPTLRCCCCCLRGDVVKDDSENIVLDEERVVGRTKDERLVERLRVVVVGLQSKRKKSFER